MCLQEERCRKLEVNSNPNQQLRFVRNAENERTPQSSIAWREFSVNCLREVASFGTSQLLPMTWGREGAVGEGSGEPGRGKGG